MQLTAVKIAEHLVKHPSRLPQDIRVQIHDRFPQDIRQRFGGGMLIAWMFIVTIPIGLFCVKAGIQLLFDETSKQETFSVFDKSKSRIVYFEYTNGELTHSLETKLKIDSRCKIIYYSWSTGSRDSDFTLEKVFITQKDGAIGLHKANGTAFAQYLGISYENKGWFANGLPVESSEWTKW